MALININIPAQYTTDAQKIRYLYRLEEVLRVLYNRMGTWYRDGGVTLIQYNNLLPTYIKNRYAYTPQLSQANWQDFLFLFRRVTAAVAFKLFPLLDSTRGDNTIAADVDTDITGYD